MRKHLMGLCVAACLAPQACVGDNPAASTADAVADAGGSTDAGGDKTPGAVTGDNGVLTVTVTAPEVVRGSSGAASVQLAWKGTAVPITLAWAGLPPGVDGGTPTAVQTDVFDASLSLAVPESIPYGDLPVQLVATSEVTSFQRIVVNVPAFVRGKSGTLDDTFGVGGNVELPPKKYGALTMTRDSQHRLLVLGQTEARTDDGFGSASDGAVLARYTEDGRFDAAFGTKGLATWSAYDGTVVLSLNDLLPEAITEAGDGYRVGLGYHPVVLQTRPATAIVASNGTVQLAPTAPPTLESLGPAIPDGEGIIYSGVQLSYLAKLGVDGAFDNAWLTAAQLAPEPPAAYSGANQRLVAANASRVLVSLSTSKGTVDTAWKGLTLIERSTGAVLVRTETPEFYTKAAALSDGGFVAISPTGATVWFDAQAGSVAVPAAVPVPSKARTSISALADGRVVVLVTEEPSHATSFTVLDGTGKAVGAPVSLPPYDITETGNNVDSYPVYAYQAFEDAHRSLVVFHRAQFGYVASSNETNPHWLIRRYWL